jgi:hypothetical protein
MKLLSLIVLTWLILWALLTLAFTITQENWQALSATTRWLLKEAAPRVFMVLLIAGFVLALMLTAGGN